MQNKPKHILPKWIVLTVVLMFCGFYGLILINHFSRHILPRYFFNASTEILAPWFYQNLTAFAPEPQLDRLVFVYRIKSSGVWTSWEYPAYPSLQKHWDNRWSTSLKTHDQLEVVGENLYISAVTNPGKSYYLEQKGRTLPAVQSCMRFIELTNESTSIDSFQVAVYVESLSVDDQGTLIKSDSALFYPKYGWYDLD